MTEAMDLRELVAYTVFRVKRHGETLEDWETCKRWPGHAHNWEIADRLLANDSPILDPAAERAGRKAAFDEGWAAMYALFLRMMQGDITLEELQQVRNPYSPETKPASTNTQEADRG